MKSNFLNILYALVLQIVIMPVLGCFTYFLYDKYTYLNLGTGYSVLFFFLIIFLVALNIFCLYYLAKAFYKVYKMPLRYYFVVGLTTSVIVSWFKIYYHFMEIVDCREVDTVKCLDSFSINRNSNIMLVLTIAYFVLFMLLYRMVKEQEIIKSKKKQ